MNYRDSIYEVEHHTIGAKTDDRLALPHHDDSVEIIQTWSDGGYFIVKNHIFPIKPGGVILINAMETHYSNPSNPDIYNRSKLIISADFFKTICKTCGLLEFSEKHIFQNGGACFTPAIDVAKDIDVYLKEATTSFSASDDKLVQARIVLAIISILSSLISSEAKEPIQDTKHTINLMAKYVNEHNNDWENLSIDGICNALHISSSRAAHLFKELMGKTIIQYKNEIRIAEAKKLLLSTNLKVQEISDMLNFQHSSIFCKYFKNMVGCTPKEYRNSKGLSITME